LASPRGGLGGRGKLKLKEEECKCKEGAIVARRSQTSKQ